MAGKTVTMLFFGITLHITKHEIMQIIAACNLAKLTHLTYCLYYVTSATDHLVHTSHSFTIQS